MIRILLAMTLMATPTLADGWYTGTSDPITHGSCCGGGDCNVFAIKPGNLLATAEGYHVVLTLEETQNINKASKAPIDAIVVWERVQPSQDGNWHLCVKPYDRQPPTKGIYCLFAPPNT